MLTKLFTPMKTLTCCLLFILASTNLSYGQAYGQGKGKGPNRNPPLLRLSSEVDSLINQNFNSLSREEKREIRVNLWQIKSLITGQPLPPNMDPDYDDYQEVPVPTLICANRPSALPLPANDHVRRQIVTVKKVIGGQYLDIDLSRYFSAKKVQIRVLDGAIKINSAEIVDIYNKRISANSLIVSNLCEEQGVTTSVTTSTKAEKLVLRIEAEKEIPQDTASIEVSIQYDNAKCAGCNFHGCYVKGGGCNFHGCYEPGGGCNFHGCYVKGGGCNFHGCWYPGGSCDFNGCHKKAPKNAGEFSKNPTCE